MGNKFREHTNGTKFFQCKTCEASLAQRKHLISTKFTGSSGKAYLFKNVINITVGNVEERTMLTGRHFVRDVRCKICTEKLGWKYEFAKAKDQQYKEGNVILECAFIQERLGFEDIAGKVKTYPIMSLLPIIRL